MRSPPTPTKQREGFSDTNHIMWNNDEDEELVRVNSALAYLELEGVEGVGVDNAELLRYHGYFSVEELDVVFCALGRDVDRMREYMCDVGLAPSDAMLVARHLHSHPPRPVHRAAGANHADLASTVPGILPGTLRRMKAAYIETVPELKVHYEDLGQEQFWNWLLIDIKMQPEHAARVIQWIESCGNLFAAPPPPPPTAALFGNASTLPFNPAAATNNTLSFGSAGAVTSPFGTASQFATLAASAAPAGSTAPPAAPQRPPRFAIYLKPVSDAHGCDVNAITCIQRVNRFQKQWGGIHITLCSFAPAARSHHANAHKASLTTSMKQAAAAIKKRRPGIGQWTIGRDGCSTPQGWIGHHWSTKGVPHAERHHGSTGGAARGTVY